MRYPAFTFATAVSMSALAMAAHTPTTAPTTSPVIDLTPNNIPAVSAADAVDVVGEGTHFVGRTGRLTHTTDGMQAMLVFDNTDSPATQSPPMLVLPNLNLFLMESVSNSKTAVEFRVSGTVTEYKGHNYILLDSAQTTLAAPVASAKPVNKLPVKPATAVPPAQLTQPKPTAVKNITGAPASADDTMNRLLATQPKSGQPIPLATTFTPPVDVSSGKAAVAPDAPVNKIVREGTHIIERIGRLNHSPDGQQAFFTFDTDGKTMQDAPMIIMPNMKLSAMEGAVLVRAGDLHFRVSGTVTEYKGRNYILLDKAVAIADVETTF